MSRCAVAVEVSLLCKLGVAPGKGTPETWIVCLGVASKYGSMISYEVAAYMD
jgi:hypothetical protein